MVPTYHSYSKSKRAEVGAGCVPTSQKGPNGRSGGEGGGCRTYIHTHIQIATCSEIVDFRETFHPAFVVRALLCGPQKHIQTFMHAYINTYMVRCLKERLQKEDRDGHIVLESIVVSPRYKAGPQGILVNPQGGARLAIDTR